MIRLNRILLALLMLLVLLACVSMVASEDSGSGSVGPDDGSPTEDVSYDNDSNTGSLDSDGEEDEDPLDEEYYDSQEAYGRGGGSDDASITVNLAEHATANPLLILILSLMSVSGLVLRH